MTSGPLPSIGGGDGAGLGQVCGWAASLLPAPVGKPVGPRPHQPLRLPAGPDALTTRVGARPRAWTLQPSLSPPSSREEGQGAGGGGPVLQDLLCPWPVCPQQDGVPGLLFPVPSACPTLGPFAGMAPQSGYPPATSPAPTGAGLRLRPRLACDLCPALAPRACFPPGWHPLPLLPDVCPRCLGTMWCPRLARLGSGAVRPWGPWPACPVEVAGLTLFTCVLRACLQWDGLSRGLATGSLGLQTRPRFRSSVEPMALSYP